MHEAGRRLGTLLRAGDLIVLTGPLGAGKTTLTRGIGEGLGIRGPVTSPTFVLARTHPSLVGGAPLVHVDAYRLGSALELDDLDIDFAGSVVVVEWGEGLLDGVSESRLEIVVERPTGSSDGAGLGDDVSEEPTEPRILTVSARGPRWQGIDLSVLGADDPGPELH
ncbi:tRNA (adenosine(37)-N6)-threonylcarbamoyltransferase complex ATPase subunit type 1 TsaE [Amnibacterium flavum]|uniref:tRNA threonylcarbamoyladenosine biosynthesis protein TsaE n=1 Tax=Amnibacterium flavum TaxID=2173173 RepID=A0A2V1HUM2_9MICO|nr:tRNA (adenosine(37)-N6)-threonylcarbamoyltransferase complex ATPase subunit type 1 TsaE [Amnibacterium flavum]PVZ96278.1 tRNA (adenosine(37)-N6)-threonylcarbamoyltransferase complex ATPase subunit type 1 TsaE [Amnibacterium flavum]